MTTTPAEPTWTLTRAQLGTTEDYADAILSQLTAAPLLDPDCGCKAAVAYRTGAAAERDRIRQLATDRVTHGGYHQDVLRFADLLGAATEGTPQ